VWKDVEGLSLREQEGRIMIGTRRSVVLAVFAAVFSVCASAEDVKGILVDVACSAKIIKEGQAAAKAHTRECALKEQCVKSGYGVYTAEGKYIVLDATGNEMAVAALKASKKTDNLMVKVSGKLTGELIEVKKLKIL